MTELEDKETLEILSNTRDQIVELVKKYNILAREKNQNTRMAYATASSWADEEEYDDEGEVKPGEVKTNYEKVVSDNYGENVGVSISSPEAGFWFPSSICQ